jgi:hypothetical protein
MSSIAQFAHGGPERSTVHRTFRAWQDSQAAAERRVLPDEIRVDFGLDWGISKTSLGALNDLPYSILNECSERWKRDAEAVCGSRVGHRKILIK